MTPELRAARAGKLTASVAAITMGGLDTSGLDGLVKDLAFERFHNEPIGDSYQSAAMLRGKELEAEALAWYQFDTMAEDLSIDPDRCIIHPRFPYVGATPDAIRSDRVVEAKSPEHRAWMEVRRTGKVPSSYRWQCHWQMWTAEKQLCDFVAWHPVCGGLIVPFPQTQEALEKIEQRAPVINNLVEEWVAVLRGEWEKAGALAKARLKK